MRGVTPVRLGGGARTGWRATAGCPGQGSARGRAGGRYRASARPCATAPTCWASPRDGRDRNLHERSFINGKYFYNYFMFTTLTCDDAIGYPTANHGRISTQQIRSHLRRKNLAINSIGFSTAPHIKPDKTRIFLIPCFSQRPGSSVIHRERPHRTSMEVDLNAQRASVRMAPS